MGPHSSFCCGDSCPRGTDEQGEGATCGHVSRRGPRPGYGEPGLARGLGCTCFSGCSRTRRGHCHPVRHSGWLGLGSGAGEGIRVESQGTRVVQALPAVPHRPGTRGRHSRWGHHTEGLCGHSLCWAVVAGGGLLAPSPSSGWEGCQGPYRSGGKAGGVSPKVPQKRHRSGAAGDGEDRCLQRPRPKNGHEVPVCPEGRDAGVAGPGAGSLPSGSGVGLGSWSPACRERPWSWAVSSSSGLVSPQPWTIGVASPRRDRPPPMCAPQPLPLPHPPSDPSPLSIASLFSVSVSLFSFWLFVYFVP